MKKLLALALIAVLALSFAACTPTQTDEPETSANETTTKFIDCTTTEPVEDTTTEPEEDTTTEPVVDTTPVRGFTALKNNEVLCIGSNTRLYNYVKTQTHESTMTCLLNATYTLYRRSSSSYTYDELVNYYNAKNPIEYEGYFYYWQTNNTSDEIVLGTVTRTQTVTYDYMTYGENHNLVVRSCSEIETSYTYKGGWKEIPFEYTVELNGYFADDAALEKACPGIFDSIDTTGTKKYYVDVTEPTTTSYNENAYTNTYFYITTDK